MSWKSTVIAGLLCVLAVPAFALEANPITAKLLGLDTAGNWVWEISVDPDQTTFTDPVDTPDRGNGGSVDIELGISAPDRGVVSAAADLTNFPNPSAAGPPFGNAPAGWGTDIDGDTLQDEGVVFNPTTDRVVAFLGSEFFGTENGFAATQNGPLAAFRIHTEKPIATSLTTTLDFLGAANANGTLGGALPIFAENGVQVGVAVASASRSVKGGNANIDGFVDLGDLAILGANYEVTPGPGDKKWQTADFTGDGHTDLGDLAVLGANYGLTGTADPNWTTPGLVNIAVSPGAGGGNAGVAVPEPTSLVMLVLGGMIAALRSRKR
jgi:hypothetical protein